MSESEIHIEVRSGSRDGDELFSYRAPVVPKVGERISAELEDQELELEVVEVVHHLRFHRVRYFNYLSSATCVVKPIESEPANV